ncbi:LLM class F420-dependent oxidoreductase [Nocardia sp. 852002-20019_SCH5090214]|jgi:F420-dependent oxidoreductase-like protein|uniref:LLM class F420-dependent oxidoreductase n=1 Tax=Nocardia TaxID=1817 RepID=UPI0007EBC5A1|nr:MULTISPECIES: LLM class F420-dependent oxidoreductase [Nocardia]OBA43788.1 LLM class F420-dependent oxidoreductase [Nocardia sp. 852002-20019_SCH5090214]
MKIGYTIQFPLGVTPAVIGEIEAMGVDSVWVPEAYGFDCLTPLAWMGATSSRLRLGTSVMQMAARTPPAAAMAALTMDHLSGGRFVLGLGVSGPQVVEGWYGQPYERPLARTREYVDIVRTVIAREEPLQYRGRFYNHPLPGGTGLGKPLKSIVHPLRRDLPVLLAAEGPKNVALAAEIADGWIAMLLGPRNDAFYRAALAEGFARRAARRPAEDFEVVTTVPVVVDDDVEAAADSVRDYLALYVGGMGAEDKNFHFDVMARMGYEDIARKVRSLYLDGHKTEAAAVIPTAMVEEIALVGPPAKIRDDLQAREHTLTTTLVVLGDMHALRTVVGCAA